MSSDYDLNENKSDDESVTRLDPPASGKRSLRDPVKMIFEILFLAVVFVPLVIRSFIVNFFFTPPKSVKGKVVLVTGSGRGLGRGLAEKFVQLGCRVACVDIDENLNRETVKKINDQYPGRAKAFKCNVAKMEDVRTLRDAVKHEFEKVDILIHNAGIIAFSSFVDQDEDFIRNIIDVNLTSHFYMTRQFLPDMIERNEGHIVAVSSIAAFGSAPKSSLYVATKHGVIGLMSCLHYELQEIPNNAIKTSTICPWFINTSEYYTKQWKLRIPEMSIEEAVEACVDGIRREKRVFSIPATSYFGLIILKLLPDSFSNLVIKVFGVNLKAPPKKVIQNTPVFKLLLSQANKTSTGLSQ